MGNTFLVEDEMIIEKEVTQKTLVKSKYAFFVEKDNGDFIVYSSLTGAIIAFTEPSYIERLQALIASDIILDEPGDDIVELLKNKRIFIEPETNESLLVRLLYEENIIRSKVLEVMLVVTMQCNLRCTYCGQNHEDKRMNQDTYDSIIEYIKLQLKNNAYSSVAINFFGGEPMLEYKGIVNFLTRLEETLKEFSGVTYIAGMSTNGYSLTPERFKTLVKLHCVQFQITVDGMHYTHNLTRPLVNGKGSWHRIIKNIENMILLEDDFAVCLRINYNREVADSLDEFLAYVEKNLNDKRISVYHETIKEHGNEDTPEILDSVSDITYGSEISSLIRKYNLNSSNAFMRLQPCGRLCSSSKPNHIVIDYDNKMFKCSHILDEQEYNCLGNLNCDGSCSLNQENYAKWVYSDYLTSEECSECKALPLCLGKSCPWHKGFTGYSHCNPDLVEIEIEEQLKSFY